MALIDACCCVISYRSCQLLENAECTVLHCEGFDGVVSTLPACSLAVLMVQTMGVHSTSIRLLDTLNTMVQLCIKLQDFATVRASRGVGEVTVQCTACVCVCLLCLPTRTGVYQARDYEEKAVAILRTHMDPARYPLLAVHVSTAPHSFE